MPFQSDQVTLQPRELADYGFAITRDAAFDAVRTLWRRRQAEGMSQIKLAEAIGRDRGWVSKNLGAPGNWTLRTFGELIQGLGGEPAISVLALEDVADKHCQSLAYEGYIYIPISLDATVQSNCSIIPMLTYVTSLCDTLSTSSHNLFVYGLDWGPTNDRSVAA